MKRRKNEANIQLEILTERVNNRFIIWPKTDVTKTGNGPGRMKYGSKAENEK